MRGLRTKLKTVRNNISLLLPQPTVIILTETFLHAGISDSELGLLNYDIFRRDRYDYPNSPYGGGVLIAVHKSLQATIAYLTRVKSAEQIFVKINSSNLKLIIGAIYLPPRSDTSLYEEHVNCVDDLKNEFPDYNFLLLGDYNLPSVIWSYSEEGLSSDYGQSDQVIEANTETITNGFTLHDFQQFIPEHPSKGYTLDLCFSSLNSSDVSIINSLDSLVPVEGHHVAHFLKIDVDINNVIRDNNQYFNFEKADYEVIENKLKSIEWDKFFKSNNVNDNVKQFYSLLYDIIKLHVPCSKACPSSYPVWYSKELINKIITKKRLHKIWLQSDFLEDYILFKKVRAQCIRLSRTCYQEYIVNIENCVSRKIKSFWNYVNNLSKNNGIPDSMYLREKKGNNTKDVCELFSYHFESVYTLPSTNQTYNPTTQLPAHAPYDLKDIALTDIDNALSKMVNKSSVGPDKIPSIFLKNCSSSILQPLRILFCQSLNQGCMPGIWKKSFITPVFKSGNRHDVQNYRPISIICCIAKLFEAIIVDKLTKHLITTVTTHQHGFVKSRSATTNLILYSDYISDALANSRQVDSIYLDFAKAFDSVDHAILIHKLINFGISGNLLNWIKSYLQERTQIVRIRGNESESILVTSGVPQGSNLGPLLFILFINDIADNLSFVKILIYADDVKLYYKVASPMDASKLQRDLDTIVQWSVINNLKLNIEKCKVISFGKKNSTIDFNYSINNSTLERVTLISDLGVMFDSQFNFKKQVEHVTSSAYHALGFIMRSTREFTKVDSIIYLYKTLVLSKLNYCSIIWSPSYQNDLNKIEAVQRKFLRYISYKIGKPMQKTDHDYSAISKSLNLTTVKSIHNYNDILFVRKALYDSFNCLDIVNLFYKREIKYAFREPRVLTECTASSNIVFHSSVFRLRRLWNSTDKDIQDTLTDNLFKKRLKLATACYY